ncbi:alpha/beta hydrolase [bacterium]|nr:MAG: alpha/beta hydrolase [bacterium]
MSFTRCSLFSRQSSSDHSPSLLFTGLRWTFGAIALSLGAIAAVNTIITARTPPMGPRLNGLFGRYPARYGDLAYAIGGEGPPIVLVHSLDPGQSSASWRAVFDLLADDFTVYAFDWQGYGLSDPNPEGLNAREFGAQLRDFIRDIVGTKATVIAHGSAAPLVLEAAESGQINGLILVCPDGSAPDEPRQTERAEFLAQKEISDRLLEFPIIGTAVLNWWRSKPNLEREAHEFALWDKSQVENEARLWHVAAHQKGAQRAQKALLKGRFAAPWRELWKNSSTPALLVWGRHARGFESASEWGALRPDASLQVVENALLMPQLDAPQEFAGFVSEWVKKHTE